MELYHVETLFRTGTNTADKYDSQTSTILASDRYIINGDEERPPDSTNTVILKTNADGKFWAVKFYASGKHECWRLDENQAVDSWAAMESVSKDAATPSPDILPFNTAFPGYTITDV
jgi:hypothetical protein